MGLMIVGDDGSWINEHYARLAEVIQDYDPNLELQWIPPGQRTDEADKKAPYRIYDNRSLSVVMHASDRDTPQTILARLWSSDNQHGNVLERLDAENAAAEALKLKERLDEQEMQKDFAAFLIGTNKNYIHTTNPVTGEKLKLDDQLRRL